MTVLAVLLQEPDVTEYIEPYNTIALVAVMALLVVYLAGLPATVAVSAVLWRQRTRPVAPRPSYAVAAAPPPDAPAPASPFPPPVPPPPPAGPGSPAQPLLALQRLEREVLGMRERQPSADAAARLAVEVRVLATRYGESSTVGRYAVGLQVIVAALAPLDTTEVLPIDPPDPPPVAGSGVPDRLRVGLGRIAASGRPIPAQWAFSWHGHRADRWPAAADGRREQLAAAFVRRYQEIYPHGGMIMALTGGRLTLTYTPASARFGGRPIEIPTGLPDVADLPEAVRRLRAVAAAALRDLHPPVIG